MKVGASDGATVDLKVGGSDGATADVKVGTSVDMKVGASDDAMGCLDVGSNVGSLVGFDGSYDGFSVDMDVLIRVGLSDGKTDDVIDGSTVDTIVGSSVTEGTVGKFDGSPLGSLVGLI